LSFGERLADKVAEFGGSWKSITLFGLLLAGWVALNSFILLNGGFDPYPYVFLNLILSMLAALQAPIIMMSQNRQAAKTDLPRPTTTRSTSRPNSRSWACTKSSISLEHSR